MLMKKILIALDYDPAASQVAEAGHLLAIELKAEITLIHVIANGSYYSLTDFAPMGFTGYIDTYPKHADIISQLKQTGQEFLDRIKDPLRNQDIKTRVEEGEFASTILEVSTELKADIIVIGSHGRRWLQVIIMGSVTEKILHHTTMPLFIIPTK